MGKTTGSNSWLNVVKKAFRSPAKDRDEGKKKNSKRREDQEQEEEEEKRKGKRRWLIRKPVTHETIIQHKEGMQDSEQRTVDLAMATTTAAAEVASRAAAEVIRLTRSYFPIREHHSAVLIQTAFRGYLARRALGALKGLVKLQALVRGQNVRKQAWITLKYMQALMRVQDRVCNQRKSLSHGRSSVSTPCIIGQSNPSSYKIITPRYDGNLSNSDEQRRKAKESFSDSEPEICLAHAFSHQMWKRSGNGREYNENVAEFSERDDVKIVEIDTIQSSTSSTNNCSSSWRKKSHCNHQEQQNRRLSASSPHQLHGFHQNLSVQSPASPLPPLCRTKPLQIQTQSTTSRPGCIGEDEDEERKYSSSVQTPARYTYYCRRYDQSGRINVPAAVQQPKYMAATASANARVRSLSAPRQRPSTPEREGNNRLTEKKRLSLADVDPDPLAGTYNVGSLQSMLRNSSSKVTGKCVLEEQKVYSPSSGGRRRWLR